MALQRFLFVSDLTDPGDRVLYYQARGEESLAQCFLRITPNAARDQADVVARLRQVDLLSPRRWAVVDATRLHQRAQHIEQPEFTTPVAGDPPAQALTFLAQGFSAIDRFVHYCNPPLARAWLREAREQIVSARSGSYRYRPGESPEQRPGDGSDQSIEQYWRGTFGRQRAVRLAWEAFAAYWQALNLRPWVWAPLRLALERALGGVGEEISFGGETYARPVPTPETYITGLGSEPFTMAPLTPEEQAQGPWRSYFLRAARAAGFPVSRILLGPPHVTPHNLSLDQDCLRRFPPDGEGDLGGGHPCYSSPKGMALSLWLQNDGQVTQPSVTRADYEARAQGFPSSEMDARLRGQRQPFPLEPGNKGNAYGETEGCRDSLRCVRSFALATDGTLSVMTPLEWHLGLLEGLVAYCETRSEFEVIHEARIHCTGKNLWTAERFRISAGDSSAASFYGAQGVASAERDRADVRRVIDLAGSAVSQGLTLALGPVGQAIGGLATDLARLVFRGLEGDTPPPPYVADVFGRPEPVMEVLQFTAAAEGSERDRAKAAAVMPPAPPYYTEAEDAVVYGWELPGGASTDPQTGLVVRPAPLVVAPLVSAETAPAPGDALRLASPGSRLVAWGGAAALAFALAYAAGRAQPPALPPPRAMAPPAARPAPRRRGR